MKTLTKEEFLERLWDKNEHYRNGEFEVVSEYKNYTTPILIKDVRGICKIDYASLVNSNYTTSISTAIDKTDYFKKELFETNKYFRNGDFEVVGDYKGRLYKIEILNKYGVCSINAESLLKGSEPSIMSAIDKEEYFSEILKEKNFKIWEKVKIIKYESFRKIFIDTAYGKMITSSDAIFEWDNLSIKSAIDKNDFWLKRARDLREGSKNIDYSNVEYIDNKKHVKLSCKVHNYTYTQRPSHHMANIQGCPHCATSTIKYSKENFEKHKEFFKDKMGVMYVLKLIGNGELFYKVGITGRDEKYRFNSISQSYKIKIEYKEEMLIEDAYNLEQFFLEDFKSKKYIPQIKFKGYTECLTTNPVAEYYHWYFNK